MNADKNTILNKYQLIEEIGRGSFSTIYKAKDIYTNKYCAIKIEPKNEDPSQGQPPVPFIVREAHIHNRLRDLIVIPNLLWFGVDSTHNLYCMILPLLMGTFRGVSCLLDTEENCSRWLQIGQQMLWSVQALHQKGYIHRDIKPDNFMYDDKGKVYLIDLGLCKQWIRNGTHIVPTRPRTGVIGTINYISVNVHNLIEPSRRDDVESVCYVLWKLCGGLDWDAPDNDMDLSTIRDCKIKLTSNPGVPIELLRLLRKTRMLEYTEEPRYDFGN